MSSFPTVSIPAFEFHFNLVVCPIPSTWLKKVCFSFKFRNFYIKIIPQDLSYFVVLRNNGVKPVPTGGSHWLEFLPNHMYCFLPSYEVDVGKAKVYECIPGQLVDFQFCMEIEKVKII